MDINIRSLTGNYQSKIRRNRYCLWRRRKLLINPKKENKNVQFWLCGSTQAEIRDLALIQLACCRHLPQKGIKK